MRVLLDHDVPHVLRHRFPEECDVETADVRGWADYGDGDLLRAAEGDFDVLVTLDTSLVYQQNVDARAIGVVVIDIHPAVPDRLAACIDKVLDALPRAAEKQSSVVVTETGWSSLR